MRWRKPEITNREITRFLLWPKTIDGETRWLEVACWAEHYAKGKWWPQHWEMMPAKKKA